MATQVRIVMNVPGYNAYRNDSSVQHLLGELADEVAARYTTAAEAFSAAHGVTPPPGGEHVTVEVNPGTTRARATVRGVSVAARLAEAHDRALLRALGGA